MSMSMGSVTVVVDGPGVMVHSAPLVLALQSAGYDVSVAVTESAALFATPFFPAMLSGHGLEPWPLSEKAVAASQVILLAPCSCQTFRKLVSGEEGQKLAAGAARLLVAPGLLPAEDTEEAWQEFAELGGGRWQVLRPCGGELSLGALGSLRVASPELCVEMVRRAQTPQDLAGKRLLVTAGPTAEDADPVRYVTNRSTGRMGVSLARMAARRGAQVTVVHGPMSWALPAVPGVEGVAVRSAQQMYEAVMSRTDEADIAILCAAVADYTPVTYSDIKIKKGHEATFALLLKRTPDILASIGRLEKRPFLVGFAAESDHVEANALGKLKGKNCDMLCANDVMEPGSGFAVGTNRVTVFLRDGGVCRLPQMSKDDVARKILDLVVEHWRPQC